MHQLERLLAFFVAKVGLSVGMTTVIFAIKVYLVYLACVVSHSRLDLFQFTRQMPF
jgi:hypothetical protein